MYNFIRKVFTRKSSEPLTIRFDAIPGWAKEREQRAKETLTTETTEPVQNIKNAMARLQHIVNTISGAEQETALHPKLKSIAKSSLPLFVRAMSASLSKELPEDVEEFYVAAVECVKNCLNSTRGQGRYLQVVFPEEMKAVRTGIDSMGREINDLTAALTKYRRESAAVRELLVLHTAIVDISTDLERSNGKEQRMTSRIDEMAVRTSAISKELDAIDLDAGMTSVIELKTALDAVEKKREIVTREYSSLSMTASHVFGKAEKIAVKQRHESEASILRRTMDILSDHEIPDCTVLINALTAACPSTLRMVEAGEIPLKNKEERAIFSDTTRFCGDMGTICTGLQKLDEEYETAEHALSSNPLVTRRNSLERELTQLKTMLSKEYASREELVQWREKTLNKLPSLHEDLKRKMEGMAGETVQIQNG